MSSAFLLVPVLLPIILGGAAYLIPFGSTLKRNIYTFTVIALSSVLVWISAFMPFSEPFVLFRFTPYLFLSFSLDGAGKIFSLLSATLWPISVLYGFEYMKDDGQTRAFWSFFTMAFGATLGVAMADNIITMYLFYELLTLFTIPLIMHGRSEKNVAAAKKYMLYSFGGAAFAFSGVTYLIYSGAQGFKFGGTLSLSGGNETLALVIFVFAFFGFGVKAAVFPFSGWLPSASVAPTPVTALLHAVAVVKAGAFAIIRLIYYSYGTSILVGTWAQMVITVFSLATILYGSVMAVKQVHFKRRLAYSTVANLSYIVFAASLMTLEGLSAAFLHLVFHSVMKITLFFAAGAVLHHTGKMHVSELEGLGSSMPLTFSFYTVAALALTGIPPLCGFASKWVIAKSAISASSALAIAGVVVLLISAFLTAVYSLSVSVKAFFPRSEMRQEKKISEIGIRMALPMGICALASVLFGVFAAPIMQLIERAVGI